MTNDMFESLTVANYRIYAAGAFVSNVGTWMQTTAQAWLVLVLTGSGTLMGVTVALQTLPSLLLGPTAGILADVYAKRRIILFSQLVMAAPAVALGVLAVCGRTQIWSLLTLAFVMGLGRAVEAPARQSFVAELVDLANLNNAVALNSVSFNSARLLGPGLAGILIAAFGGGESGTGWVILLNALSYAAAVLGILLLDRSQLAPHRSLPRRPGALREGVRYVRSRPDLMLLLWCVLVLGTFGMNFQITSALMATAVFGKGATEYGVLGSLLALGSLSGALLAARRRRPRLRFIVLSGLSFAGLQVASGLAPTFGVYAGLLPLVGLCLITATATANSAVQVTTEPRFRGRVASFFMMVLMGSVPFGSPVTGWIGETFGARVALVGAGSLTGLGILAGVGCFLWTGRTRVRR